MNGVEVLLEDGTKRPATDDELAVYATLCRGSSRGVNAIEHARAARDRAEIARLIIRCAELEHRVAELEAELERVT